MRRPRGRPGRRVLVLVALVVLLAAGGAGAWARAAPSPASRYRTAVATVGTVTERLTTTGTVARLGQASLAFARAGTVATVPVALGDRVTRGQVVATLDRTALRTAVTEAEAALARAKAALAADRTAQQTAAATPTPTPTPSSAAEAPGGKKTSNPLAGLTAAQRSVLDAQRAADQARQVATSALQHQTAACTPEATASGADAVAACRTSLDAVQVAQTSVADAQASVDHALGRLGAVLTAAATSLTATSATAGSQATGPTASAAKSTSSSSASGSRSGGPSSGSTVGSTVTAATLARDQATVDSAHATLLRANHDLATARLVAPVSGTVGALTIAVGDTVSAGGAGQVVVVGDDGQVQVTVDVGEADIATVKVGQQATVTPDGAGSGLRGVVTDVGLLSASTSGTASYPVTVSVADAPASLASGSDAGVALVVSTARQVVTVPSSAVTTTAAGAVVRVLDNGTATTSRVQVGAVGTVRTEIRSGLKAGQQVVLADLSQPLPTNDSGSGLRGGPGQGLTSGGPPGGFRPGGVQGGGRTGG
jgi:multidrug efflux pump subunit AcrA (membrane-fusion protein)